MINRLFLASYEDIQDWGSRAERLLSTVDNNDTIFLIRSAPLNASKEKMIQKLKDAATVRISETEGQNSGVIGKALLSEFLKKEPPEKYTVYIIGASLKCLYEDRTDFESLAAEVFYNHNFQVKKLKIKDTDDSMQLFMDAVMENMPVTDKENKTTNVHQASKKDISSLRAEKNKRNRSDKALSIETQRSSVEKKIFGTVFESKEYEEPFTMFQEARAKFIFELQERTGRHIRKKMFQKKETITFTQEEFYDFVKLIMSSGDEETFNDSWSLQHSQKLELNTETYKSIKAEIAFFNQICEFVYEKDYWED